MAAAVARSSTGPGRDDAFLAVFPKINFTTPTPESTPTIGSISSPGIPFGGFSSFGNDAGETAKYNRAWSTATRFLGLSADGKYKPITSDLIDAVSDLIQHDNVQKDLANWYVNEIGTHFRGVILPELRVWQQPILLSQADQVLRLTIQLLLKAKRHYFDDIDRLASTVSTMGDRELIHRIASFRLQVLRDFRVLVVHSLPSQRLQSTLTSIIYQKLEHSVHNSSDAEECADHDRCQCELDLGDLPLAELHEVGLGGSLGERAFAHAIHRFLQTSAIQRRCFEVDWIDHQTVIPKLRTWVSQYVVPMAEKALAALKGDKTLKLAPNDAQQLVSMAISNIGRLRISSLFNYVKAWPASRGAIMDVWEYLNAGSQADKTYVCQRYSDQIQRRLLHAGASTSEILGIYVNVIHTFKALDGRGVLLEKVAVPIRNYLRSRDDAVSIIAASFLADTDEDGNLTPADADKVCLDISAEVANTTLSSNRDTQLPDWDDMEWMPDPIDAGPDYHSSKSEDVVAQVLGLFDHEDFIKEITTVLAQHLLHSTDFNYVKETRLVELLKSRLDVSKLEKKLENTEVMLKDMRDSVALGKRTNPSAWSEPFGSAPTPREIQTAIPEEGITLSELYSNFQQRMKRPQFMAAVKLVANKRNDLFYAKRTRLPPAAEETRPSNGQTAFRAQILSSNCWPQLRSNEFNMPEALQSLQFAFEQKFNSLGSQRRLVFRPALSRVAIKLELSDRVVEEADVPGWRASVIDAFQEYDESIGITSAELEEKLMMDEELVMDALNFWTGKGVLFQRTPGAYAVLETLDMDMGGLEQQVQPQDDLASAVVSQDAMLRESAPMFETFIANMLRNQGAKEIGGMMGITGLLKMVLPTFTYGDEEVRWLLSEMEKKGQVKTSDGETWSIAG